MAAIESLPLRHTVWVAEKFACVSARIAENRRNSAGLAFKPHRRKSPVESRGRVFWRFSLEAHAQSGFNDDTAFVDGVAQSMEATLENRNAILVIVTECHRANLLQKLMADGVDVDSAVERRLLIFLDV